jgi:hypothetical protein
MSWSTMDLKRPRRQSLADAAKIDRTEVELSTLDALTLAQLREVWKVRFGTEAPPVRSRDILLHLLGWRIQAEAFGGLDAKTERKLREIGEAVERDANYDAHVRAPLSPGVILTREWRGRTHRVAVTTTGFRHEDRDYGSLSDAARAITGTRWSGPRFFGLDQRKRNRTSGET